ncbi:MAG: hypothetical protein WCX97_04235 [Candidatus Magasanikbacteria bacterium]
MLKEIALLSLFGQPVIMYGGIFTLLLFLIVGIIGLVIHSGKSRISMSWHINLARLALVIGLIHAILGISLFF